MESIDPRSLDWVEWEEEEEEEEERDDAAATAVMFVFMLALGVVLTSRVSNFAVDLAAELGDAALAAQAGHHQLELLLRRELPVPACLAQRGLLMR